MASFEKLSLLSHQMDVELDSNHESFSCFKTFSEDHIYISHATLPNGKKLKLLKTVLTSACENNCFYCAFRAGRDFRRVTFQPDELANTVLCLYNAGIIQGIFLSSGIIKGGMQTQDKLIDAAEILRYKLNFKGYIHLKIMPGAEFSQIARGMQLANRVSINLEAPNAQRLALIAPHKSFDDGLLNPIKWIDQICQTEDPYLGWDYHWPSSSTQFVVGAAGENDFELLSTIDMLYHQFHLKRAYFSKFKPIPDTPLFEKTGESPTRELRLYQASFLMRDYGFRLHDIPLNEQGFLHQQADPKYTWAKLHLCQAPIEINCADKYLLLRIPGIGPKSAHLIIEQRRYHKISSLDDLYKLGLNTPKIAPFILLNGKKPAIQKSFTFVDS